MPEASAATEAPWTIARVLTWAADDFKSRGIDNARLDAEVLLAHLLGTDRVRLIVDAKRPLTPAELASYREAIKRRRRAEPIAYIVGKREFHGLAFRVDVRVLVPRPDTETLVDVALAGTEAQSMFGAALDLCTGSGCVAIAFARRRPTWTVTGADISAPAIALARENATRLGAVWNVRFALGDLFAAVPPLETFDLITANPPYIPTAECAALEATVRDFEPRIALDGGKDGLSIVRRIVSEAPARLAEGGLLAIEVMAGQAATVESLMRDVGLRDLLRHLDYAGIERVVSARR